MGFRNLWETFIEPAQPATVGERPLDYGMYVNEVRTPEEIAALELAYQSVEDATAEPDSRRIGRIAMPPLTPREPDPDYWDKPGMLGA